MKLLTLLIGTLFCANGVFAATGDSTYRTHSTQSGAKGKKDLSKLMGPGAATAAEQMKPENKKLKEAAELERDGRILESQVARGVAELHREDRISKGPEDLQKQKLDIEKLKTSSNQAYKKFVDAAKKNKADTTWIKGEEAQKLKEAMVDANKALFDAEKKYKDCEGAVVAEKTADAAAAA